MSQEINFYNRYWENANLKANAFDQHPGEWEKENFLYHVNFFRSYIKGKALDFGCGHGQFTQMISRYCDSVIGIDCSPVAIEKARKNHPAIEFELLDESGRFPYDDNSFDTVFAIDVLEHILDTEGILGEINRVLKIGGSLLIATNELTPLKAALISLSSLDSYFYPASPYIRYFTRTNLAHILKKKHFTPVRYKKNRTYFGFIPKGQMVIASKTKAKDR